VNIISGPNLNNLTTFRIGGKARFFCAVNSIEDIEKALDYASNNNLKIFILGGGSNILFSDQGFDGLVIKMEMKGVNIEDVDSEKTFVEAYAGEVWDDFVNFVVDKGLYGLENLSYIPGTVGASPVQNIGAYGSEEGCR
jgi:UDP-N-acetylmuramate dehydrogenase